MFCSSNYPITVAEFDEYARRADRYLGNDEHESLKSFLALHPDYGDSIPDTNGIRILRWPIKATTRTPPTRVVYFFRDLNMPLYLVAIYEKGERIPLNASWRREMASLVDRLIAQHSKVWAKVIGILDNGA
jgi:hypothetical protein